MREGGGQKAKKISDILSGSSQKANERRERHEEGPSSLSVACPVLRCSVHYHSGMKVQHHVIPSETKAITKE